MNLLFGVVLPAIADQFL